MVRLTRTAWASAMPGVREAVGASASASATDMAIPTITRGGDRGAGMDRAAGLRPGAGAGEDMPARTCTGAGATPPTRGRRRRGQTLTRAIMALAVGLPFTTNSAARLAWADEVPTQTSTRVTLLGDEEALFTTRRAELWLEGALGTPGTSTLDRAPLGVVDSSTTRRRAPALLAARTTCMPAKTAPYTATTGRTATGRRTPAAAGRAPRSQAWN